MKKSKRAFTTIELLVVMVVSMILLTLLFLLLYHTNKLYNDVVTKRDDSGYALVLMSDIENLTRGCDHASIDEEGRKLIIHYQDVEHVIDTNDYGIDARIMVDNELRIITVYVGGEVYCITYILDAHL